MISKITVGLLLFFTRVHFGAAIRCYDCNSINNTMCIDPTLYDAETLQKFLRTTECTQGIFATQQQEFFCRKIVQTILHKNHDSDVRVTRGCGWVRHRRECYKADNEDHLETVCQCFSDHCNAAPATRTVAALVLTIAGLSMLRWLNLN